MSNFITEENLAKIAIKKNLVKEYKNSNSNRVVYLNNGTEFQIYLKNPYQYHVGIKIYVNDKSIGNMLVLRPGQSWWLDRFINNNSKFLFSTYEVEDTPEMNYATNKNGKVRIEFYPEDERLTNNDWYRVRDYTVLNGDPYKYSNHTWIYNSTYGPLNSDFLSNKSLSCKYNSNISNTLTSYNTAATLSCDFPTQNTKSIETGMVEKGNESDQRFEKCDIEFKYSPIKVENIQILPSSRKQMRTEDTVRRYCSNCGKKVSPKDNFCSSCGSKLK